MLTTIALPKDSFPPSFLIQIQLAISLHVLKQHNLRSILLFFVVSTLCFLALAAGGVFHIWISGNMVCVGHIRMSIWAICFAVMCLVLSFWDVRTDFHIVCWIDQIQICKSREEKAGARAQTTLSKHILGEEMQYPVNICTLLLTSYLWLTSSQLQSLRQNLLAQVQKFAIWVCMQLNQTDPTSLEVMARHTPTLRAMGPAASLTQPWPWGREAVSCFSCFSEQTKLWLNFLTNLTRKYSPHFILP